MIDEELENDEFVKQLNKKVIKRRIVFGIVALIFLAAGIAFSVMYAASRTEEVIGGALFPYTVVEYNSAWLYGVVPSWLIFGVSCALLVADVLFGGLHAVRSGSLNIVIYLGIFCNKLYINGKLLDTHGLINFRSFLEGDAEGVKVTAASQWFKGFHITFSDGRAPIDL